MNGNEKANKANIARIYGTLGPSCADEQTLQAMIRQGMSGVRLNLSHTMLEDASELVKAYHRACKACGVEAELLIDMQGPELRIGALEKPLKLANEELINDNELALPAEVVSELDAIPIGTELLMDDGKLLLVLEKPKLFRVLRGGVLESRKSVALVGALINTPAMTEADRRNIDLARECGVTAVMQPFVRGRDDLLSVRSALNEAGCESVRILAKIENAQGMAALDDIIPFCDEIVIARGDLGNSMNLWQLPAAQKRIAKVCRKAGRDFMVVTQMLDSMMHRAVPTRAEVSDIFNAVLDGASSVMVTGETASGEYPVESMRYLAKTVREAERYILENHSNN